MAMNNASVDPTGIIGIITGLLGLFVSIFLAFYVRHLDNKRKDREEEYYVLQTKNNLNQITHIFRDVTTISNGKNNGTWDTEEQEEITFSLQSYFSDNYSQIQYLIQNTEMCLAKWQSLDAEKRKSIQEMTDALRWLIVTYFPRDAGSISTHMRIWTAHYKDLHARKNRINELVDLVKT